MHEYSLKTHCKQVTGSYAFACRFEDHEGCHSSVKQRLEAARASDELFNRATQQPTTERNPVPAQRRGEKIRFIPPTGF